MCPSLPDQSGPRPAHSAGGDSVAFTVRSRAATPRIPRRIDNLDERSRFEPIRFANPPDREDADGRIITGDRVELRRGVLRVEVIVTRADDEGASLVGDVTALITPPGEPEPTDVRLGDTVRFQDQNVFTCRRR